VQVIEELSSEAFTTSKVDNSMIIREQMATNLSNNRKKESYPQ
jgi:hypothetical protein